MGCSTKKHPWIQALRKTSECMADAAYFFSITRLLASSIVVIFQGIGKDVPRDQRTPMGNPYISPITRGYLWVIIPKNP